MSDKVNPGQPFKPSAAAWNSFVDAATFAKNNGGGSGGRGGSSGGAETKLIITIRNDTGVDQNRWAALKLTDPVISPTDNENEFINRIVFKGVTPDEESSGRWAVLVEPVRSGEFGRAVISGATTCKINVTDVAHTHCDTQIDSTVLTSGSGGAAQILWVAGGVGTATATGVQYAIIRIGSGGGSDEGIWIKITSATPLSGEDYKWTYGWEEVRHEQYNTWTTKPGGISSGSTGLVAYNSAEAGHVASGELGSGIATSALPSGWTPQAIGIGSVWKAWLVRNCASEVTAGVTADYYDVIFFAPTSLDGACT